MKKLIIHFYSDNIENVETFKNIVENIEKVSLKILENEEEVINSISSHGFDLLLLDHALDENIQNRIFKMTEIVYPTSAFTTISFEFKSFITLKLNQLIANWEEAQRDDEPIRFFDNPL